MNPVICATTPCGNDVGIGPQYLSIGFSGYVCRWIEEQLELDVVGITKNQDNGPRDGVGWSDVGMDDSRGVQTCGPVVEFRSLGHAERQMVQTNVALIERALGAAAVIGQSEPCRQTVVAEEHLAARSVGRLIPANSLKPKNLHVPRSARLKISNREAEMVDPSNHVA
jgi:hypothetical protein